jgi:hypothetical protein
MKLLKNLGYIENIIITILAMLLPWSILFASPQLHIGYWGQVEGMIVFNHFSTAIISLLLLRIVILNKDVKKYFAHPLVFLPAMIGFYTIFSSMFNRLPIFTLYGSPQLGQGAFWYLSLSLLTFTYFYISRIYKIKLIILINLFFVTLVVLIGSFFPTITGIVISFFGFNDWLALYLTSFVLLTMYFIEMYNFKIKKEVLGLIIFFILGPLFWKIDNNSAILLWFLISLAWIIWLTSFYYSRKLKFISNLIFNPIFFTFIPIILSFIMVLSSFVFWDGKTDMTDEITNSLGHLATLVARGSIVRVLFEHLLSFQALLVGYGWGSISELLIKSFTPEVFYQINTGNRVHFHTHNELFEHIFSVGLIGAAIYLIYIYNIFKNAFKISIALSFLWLLYFCIGVFWFTWISSISYQAILAAFLISKDFSGFDNKYFNIIKKIYNSLYFTEFYIIFLAFFLFYGSYIGYYTAYNHMDSFRSYSLIKLAEESDKTNKCSEKVSDFGKGGLQFSQKFNGYNNYFKDQVLLYGVLNDTDYKVLNWHLCASHEMIEENNASIELINVHINSLSTVSILPGKLGQKTRILNKKYIDLWEEKLLLLLSLAPKRVDQAIPIISFYLNTGEDEGIVRICDYLSKGIYYQGFCDLALGSIAIKHGKLNEGLLLIKKARDLGVLDSKDIDKKTANYLKKLLRDNIK